MKRYIVFISIFLHVFVQAQDLRVDSPVIKRYIRGSEKVAFCTIADSYTPISHYDHDEYYFSGSISGVKVDYLAGDPLVTGKDIYGGAITAEGVKAITNDLLIFAMVNNFHMNGISESRLFGSNKNVLEAYSDFTSLTSIIGVAYDRFDSDVFSIPIFFGLYGQYYSINLESDEYVYDDSTYGVDTEAKCIIDESGFIGGIASGGAFSYQFIKGYKVIIYYMYIYNINNPNVEAEIEYVNSSTLTDETIKTEYDIGYISTGLLGLDFNVQLTRKYALSVSIGSFLSSYLEFYNEYFFDKTKVINLSLSLTYLL